jgi:hypothetical protein
LSEQKALESAGTYGNLFQAFGITQDAAQEMSMTMVELAADLASFNNTSIEDALEAIRSGLSGETEPLKRYGAALTEARMKQEALNIGIYDGTGALSAAQKAQAAYALILKDTQLAQGDVARTAGGYANQVKFLQSQFENLTAQLGTMLLPVVLNVVKGLNSLVTGTQGAITAVQENSRAVVIATASIAALTTAIALNRIGGIAFALQYAAHTVQLGAYTIAARGATIATATLSATMRMIPFVFAIAGLTALVTELDKGADESAKLREEVYRTARATRDLTDANGNLTQSTINAAKQGRFYRGVTTELNAAISATVGAAVAAGNAMSGNLTPNTYDAADAADKASKSYLELWEAIWNAKNAASDLANTSGTVTSALAQGARTGGVREYWQSLTVAYGETEKAVGKAGAASKDSAKAFAQLRGEMEKTFTQSMRDAIIETTNSLSNALDEAKGKVTEFARNMQSTILTGFGIGKSFEGALNEEGKVNASAWIQAVDAEVAKWEWFGNVLQAVRGPGNDPARQALAEYLAGEGADKGGVMGQALIENGLIDTMAMKMQLVRDQAGIVAQNMVPEFLKAGVDSAQNTYDGFKLAAGKGGPVYEALQGLMDRLAASMKRETTITVTTINRQINEVIGSFGYGGPRAMGGPVAADTAYLVGERGPELFVPDVSGSIVPNGGSPSSTGAVAGGGITLNVYAGMGTDGGDVGRQIVDALRQYERRNGPVPITVR